MSEMTTNQKDIDDNDDCDYFCGDDDDDYD